MVVRDTLYRSLGYETYVESERLEVLMLLGWRRYIV